MSTRRMLSFLLLLFLPVLFGVSSQNALPDDEATLRSEARAAQAEGNFKDAFERFEKLVMNPATDPGTVGDDLTRAVACLQELNREREVDGFRDRALAVHGRNPRFLRAAARTCLEGSHSGYMVAGEFHRGYHPGGGRYMDSRERDRALALRLYHQAMTHWGEDEDPKELAGFYAEFAEAVLWSRRGSAAWRLQVLTDLEELPDYREEYYSNAGAGGAPVDGAGRPVFYRCPSSFDAAASDGERWRWCLERAMAIDPSRRPALRMGFADFLREQFGVQTLEEYRRFFDRSGGEEETRAGIFTLHTLGENETLARLAGGVKRFELPDEFNYIKIYREIAEGPESEYGERAWETLAGIFENRRQYEKAAACWEESIERYGPGRKAYKKQRLVRIRGNFGTLEPADTQPAGKGATIAYRFRNGKKVHFEAYALDVEGILRDLKAYLRSNPRKPDSYRFDLNRIGYGLVREKEGTYVRDRVAAWDLALEPRPHHFDKRIFVTTPLQQAGAYLLKARMEEGNESRAVLWVADTVIVKKPVERGTLYLVVDARTGMPVPKANVEFFGYRPQRVKGKRRRVLRRYDVLTRNFARFTDAGGRVRLDEKELEKEYTWLAVARAEGGRLAFLGFSHLWYRSDSPGRYEQDKCFLVTDRPVYRPGQAVKFKGWVRRARYDLEERSFFARTSVEVKIQNPRREAVLKQVFTTDEYGGFDGEITLPRDAALGVYYISTPWGGGNFRVEEYKKPEFEVTVEGPEKPVALGERITAKIRAKYYFGAPVTEGTVHYKVLRSAHDTSWYPPGPWDWFYGPGYGWLGCDYTWYPGWEAWGCVRPRSQSLWAPWDWDSLWIPWNSALSELVMEGEAEIGLDGTMELSIDTAFAKAIHGDQDHLYTITAEVTDASRRTITGQGRVIAARRPFRVTAWVDRGYYHVGDTVQVRFKTVTPDGRPVVGKGEIRLFSVRYKEDGTPVETVIETRPVETDPAGEGRLRFSASAAGQYRLSCRITDAAGHAEEGGYIFLVRGEGFDGSSFRFNHLELVPDKAAYAPGEKVRLMIDTDRPDSTVFLFLRPVNGVYGTPEILRVPGKSTVFEIEVSRADMPNFFVEALTVQDGRIYTEVREIAVPPEKRILDLEVLPSAEEYEPGAKAKVRIRVKDLQGRPFAGSLAVTVYDKAVEYVSGGSNVPEIKAFFWKWRRRHALWMESSLSGTGHYRGVYTEPSMESIGIFGYLTADMEPFEGGEGALLESKVSVEYLRRDGLVDGDTAVEAESRNLGITMYAPAAAKARAGSETGGPAGGPPLVQPAVRKQFADTAYWAAAITTDADGFAEIAFPMPENLTAWKIRAWAVGHGTRVGEGAVEVRTSKKLLLRLQAPRFFVERDEVVLSANIHNYLEHEKAVEAVLELGGGVLEPMEAAARRVTVPAGGETRVDWRVRVVREGEAVVRMKALTDEASDAMEMRFPARVHGMTKTVSWSGAIRPDRSEASLTLHVPEERRVDETSLVIRYSPTLAGALVDALPYLADYPYGCTEQTLNRFLPAVITRKVLLDLGLDLAAIRGKRVNLNAQQLGDAKARAAEWKRFDRNPVFDEDLLADMARAGIERLTSMQCSDGGWGWFSGYGEHSSPHTTAVVVHGLQIARACDLALVPGVLERGIAWLKRYREEEIRELENAPAKKRPYKSRADDLDAFVYFVLADEGIFNEKMRTFLYRDRTQLSVYAKALFGLALHKEGKTELRDMLLRNIEQYLVRDEENQTCRLNLPGGGWWYWYGSETEAEAWYLKLLAAVDPKGPEAAGLAKYLVNGRAHGTYWKSTRDTAYCIEALADFLHASGEGAPNMTVEILLDGRVLETVHIDKENLFTFDGTVRLEGDAVEGGEHVLTFRRKGKGPLYFNAYLSYFSLEEFITRAGLEVKVDRKVYRLVPGEASVDVSGSRGQALKQKVEKYRREPLESGAALKSGDLVEVELTIESKNDYEYLVFEDFKAAGFEPMEVRSGYLWRGLHAYMELRDERTAFFVDRLARGRHSVSYRLRAEIPGAFSALPARAYAMYAPELKGNSDEIKLKIADR